MNTLDKLNIFLVDDNVRKTSKIRLFEMFFKYPQPIHGIEAKLYLQNMFDEEFNEFINNLNDSENVSQKVALWIYKNYFVEDENKKSLDWDRSSENRLKIILEKFLHDN